MAKIKLGALANDVRGSVAGQTFSRGRYGAYSRQKVSGVQPRTARQMDVRAIFAEVSQLWRTLTAAQQAAWNAWATNHPIVDVFGDAQILAGNAAFTKVNANRLTVGLVTTLVPPADPTSPTTPAPALSASADVSDAEVTVVTEAQVEASGFYEVWCSPGVSPGATPGRQACRLAGVVATVVDAEEVVANPTTFNPKLGFIAGQKVVVFVVRVTTAGVIVDSSRFDVIAVA